MKVIRDQFPILHSWYVEVEASGSIRSLRFPPVYRALFLYRIASCWVPSFYSTRLQTENFVHSFHLSSANVQSLGATSLCFQSLWISDNFSKGSKREARPGCLWSREDKRIILGTEGEFKALWPCLVISENYLKWFHTRGRNKSPNIHMAVLGSSYGIDYPGKLPQTDVLVRYILLLVCRTDDRFPGSCRVTRNRADCRPSV